MTQSKNVKHKALVQELKSRRAKGERNLMIRKKSGSIIVRYTRVVSKESGSSNSTPVSHRSWYPFYINKSVTRSSGAGHHTTLVDQYTKCVK